MKNICIIFSFLITSVSLIGQDQVKILIDEGVQLHDEKKFDKAIEKYKEALVIDSDSWLACYELSYTYFELKDYENCIQYAEESINNDRNNSYSSYVILGSAYDLMGKPKKAVKTYGKGIKKFFDKYLLYYNLGLTQYNLMESNDAKKNIEKAIELNPNHASSHLVLAHIGANDAQRTPAVLSLYYFLMLEPDSQRSKDALDLLKRLLKKGVTRRDENNVDVTLTMNKGNEFGASELMMSLLEASKNLEENKDKSPGELFYENTESFFTILSELNEKNKAKDFHKRFYVPFFKQVVAEGHVEAFSYYIQISSEDKEVLLWLEMNRDKIAKFASWFETQNN